MTLPGVIPANAGIQSIFERNPWIPEPAPDLIRGQARNDGAVIPANASTTVIPANAGIQSIFERNPWIPGQARNDGAVIPAALHALDSASRGGNAGIQYAWPVKQPCVYILASQRNGTLYVGVTSNLVQRIWQHKSDLVDGFTKKYGVHMLVWYEAHETMESAIAREKALKSWRRKWKLDLIESANPAWRDLYGDIV